MNGLNAGTGGNNGGNCIINHSIGLSAANLANGVHFGAGGGVDSGGGNGCNPGMGISNSFEAHTYY